MTGPGQPDAHRSYERAFAWLVIAAVPVYFLALGANSIWDANEAFYVETPRQMVLSGDWITPYWNAELRVNKPVLSYWIVGALYQLFGVSVAVERFGIALGAVGIIAGTFVIGRALTSSGVGWLAALIVATAPRVVMFSRRIFIDVYLTLFTTVALACFVLAVRHPERRRRYLRLMYVAIGLGVLTKGPVALVLPGAVAVAWMVMERRLSDIRHMSLVSGAAIVIAIVAPWYVALYFTHGWGPVVGFFVGENVTRFTTSMVPGDRNVLFYLPVLFGDLFPWAPMLLVPIASAWRRRGEAEDPSHAAIRRLLWTWIVVFVGAFSLSETKQDLYIYPVVPAVAALVADALKTSAWGRLHAWPGRALVAVSLLSITGAATALYLFSSGYYQLSSVPTAAAMLIVGSAFVIVAVVRRTPERALVTLAATFVAFNYVFVWRVLPELERLKPAVPLAEAFRQRASQTVDLADFNGALPPSFVFYVDRSVQRVGDLDHAVAFFANPRGGWMLIGENDLGSITALVPGLCEVARRPFFEGKPRSLIAGQPPAGVVLVTNQCAASDRVLTR
jgi:4-amino-4-deoxy-L-arabinose transferase-like glycosyltransferase